MLKSALLTVAVSLALSPAALAAPAAAPLTHAQLVKQANAICAAATAAGRKLGNPRVATAAAQARAVAAVRSILRTQIQGMRTLQGPAGDQKLLGQAVALLEREDAALAKARAAVLKRDKKAFVDAVDAASLAEAKAVAVGRRLGFTACTK